MSATLPIHSKVFVAQTKQFSRNDIVVFDYYGLDYSTAEDYDFDYRNLKKAWQKRLSRLIAISGDTLQIINDDVYINKKLSPLPEKALLPYNIYAKTDVLESLPAYEANDNSGSRFIELKKDTFLYLSYLTRAEANNISKMKDSIFKVVRFSWPEENNVDSFFAKNSYSDSWSQTNYGPLYIPKKGETVLVNKENYTLYENIPGAKEGNFIIPENLFFVLGDNRYGAHDSRYFGFISESNMHGIVK